MKKIKLNKIKIKKAKSNKPKSEISKEKTKNTILSGILIAGIAFVSAVLIFALYIIISSPDFDKEKLYSKESSVLYYNDGETELARIGSEDRVLVTYDDLPQVLIDAIVATEDSRFFQHNGLDLARFLKASAGQLLGRKESGGASTLTMQVVKRAYTSAEADGIEGIIRKFTDIYMAVFKVESNYTKEEIIEFYVNSQWFAYDGNLYSNGIAGVEQACQYFFGKSVSDLTLAEASIIAGLFQNPAWYSPYRYPERLEKRQKTVLKLMVNHGYITEDEMNYVLSIPLESLFVEKEGNSFGSSQAAIDYVMTEVKNKTGYDPSTVPMKIVTTINKDVQNVLNQLENGEIYTFKNEYLQEGIAITDTDNGAIVGLSGGRNYSAKGTNRATTKRQPGSTAKIIFDYGPAIEYLNWSPSYQLLDEPTTYSNGTAIKNSDGRYNGLMTMREALVQSRNIPALRAFKAVYAENPDYIKDFAHNLGIDYGEELYESASIGGFDGVTPVQMSAAYAAYGRGGYYIEPYSYTSITLLESGQTIEYKYEKKKVMSEETAYMVTDMLISAAQSGVGGVSVSGTQIAAKSGTSNVDRTAAQKAGIPTSATRDAWNITYSPEYSIALWVGYDSTTKEHYLTVTDGSQARNAIMKAVGSRVYSRNKTFNEPNSIVAVEIESETYPAQLASDFTPSNLRTTTIFKEGTEPTEVSTRFSKLNAPTNGNYTSDGKNIKLTWNGISTPDAINTKYLKDYFNEYYDDRASEHYEERISYNKKYIGTLEYQIFKKNADGSLSLVGKTDKTSYTVAAKEESATYVIKSAYSIFTDNMSDGLEIKTKTNIDSNVDNMINNPTDENETNINNNDNTNNNNSTNELE